MGQLRYETREILGEIECHSEAEEHHGHHKKSTGTYGAALSFSSSWYRDRRFRV